MGAQDRTDAKLAAIAPGEYLGVDAPNDRDCPEGYYVVQATSAAYQLETAAELAEFRDDDGKPLQLPAGSWVVDGKYLNPVRRVQGAKHWYLPYPADDSRGHVRVPSHFVLHAGFAMTRAEEPESQTARKRSRYDPADARRDAVAQGAVVLPLAVHSAMMDEQDLRRE